MAQLVIASAGAVVGSFFGPLGTQIGWAVGSAIGASFGPTQRVKGPRLEDLRVTGTEYGQTIPWVAGHPRVAGQIWWASDRREISTTTEVGKGGGGAEQTTYTYEVDLLIGLCDRVIEAVTRVWLNGKLIWSQLSASDDATLSASQSEAPWSRFTVYTGAADQMPDATYEAVLGAGNAPAYRGRGSVFIQGLQLGNSGVIPNLTFEVAVDADITPSDMRLLCNFDGGSTEDVSAYQVGEAIQVGDDWVFSDGEASFLQQPGENNTLEWADEALRVDAGAMVVEFITQVDPVSPSEEPPASIQLGRFYPNSANALYWNFQLDGLVAGINAFAVSGPGGTANATDTVDGISRKYHFAIQFRADGTFDYYLHGTRFTPASNNSPAVHADQARLVIGGDGSASQTARVRFTDVRLVAAELYTGATISVPSELTALYSTADPNDETLQSVVEAICARAGMPAGTYDATALASITKPVRAFALSQVGSARAALEQLQAAYFFDAYCTDKLYFAPRGGASAATIDADDLGSGLDQPADERLPLQVANDVEVFAQVALTYPNVDADYTADTQHSDRLITEQVSTSALQLAVGMTASEAKGVADAMVMDAYTSRVECRLALPMLYAELTPTDVVTASDDDGNTFRIRVVRRTDSGPLIELEGVLDDASALQSAGITSDDYTPSLTVALPGDTLMRLLDIPLLRDADDTLGHYVAAGSAATTWPGAAIYRSTDGVEYTQAATVSERAVIGSALNVLADFTGGQVFDERSSVTVSVGTTLSSSTRSAMLADTSVNVMLIGDEILRYRTATLSSAGVYILTGLLRGQRGTEWAMGTHAAGDRVVLLRTAGLRYVTIDTPSLSVSRSYKGVTLGRALADVTAQTLTCQGISLKPLAPVQLRALRVPGGDIDLTWNCRTRLAATFTGPAGATVPLGEAAESYSIDVVLLSGPTVLRTITASTGEATYTAAQQVADGVSAGTAIRFDVHQVSATVGRGYAAQVSTVGGVSPQAQITEITVGGTFATGAVLDVTLAGTTYTHTTVGGDTDLDGIADSLAAVIDAAAAYTASATGAVVTVTGAVSAAYPVTARVRPGDNTATWSLVQTASAEVAGVAASVSLRFLNLADPAGADAYPIGTLFGVQVKRTSPPLTLTYSTFNTSPYSDYRALSWVSDEIIADYVASGDVSAYGFIIIRDPLEYELSTLLMYTPADDPFNWSISGFVSESSINVLSGTRSAGVEPASLRPQIVTLTLAGTPTSGWVYRATLAGDAFDYTATGGDTTMADVATGLAAVIDADGDYIASAVGAVITITHASNNVPFTYAATIVPSTVTLSASITQEAA